ncbi:MAG: ATP-dependent DNA helicase DinG [Paraglaciecola sp.]
MIKRYFSAGGALDKVIDGYTARQPQIDMAVAIDRVITDKGNLIVEAETGTGKTFAYLIPALINDKTTIISTGSKNLQEQLFNRDLPFIIDALESKAKTALLKGRNNYLCIERLSRLAKETDYQSETILNDYVKIRGWSNITISGDMSSVPGLKDDAAILPLVTSTNDNCLGRDCPDFDNCYLVKARKKALEADVVIVNHHLYFADLNVKDSGFGRLLPDADLIVFDEAHQIPDIASEYFGKSISSRQIQTLCKDVQYLGRTDLKDTIQVTKAANGLANATQDLRLSFAMETGRGNWRKLLYQADVMKTVTRFQDQLNFIYEVLKLSLGRSELVDHCFERIVEIKSKFQQIMAVNDTGQSYWFDCTKRNFTLNITPLNIAERFSSEQKKNQAAWVFTSATLAVDNCFSHYRQLMGLDKVTELILASPFDYQNQAMLCVPRNIPEPNDPNIASILVEKLAPVIIENKGRCFFLCTSHYMVRQIANLLQPRLSMPIFVQGQDNKQVLLDRFVEHGNALLIGTYSFWEGIDVRGQALSCVIIDKLPFASPDDPLLQARIEDCQRKGEDPFVVLQIPKAVISLKQGVGRLIRDVKDTGCVVICDTRIVSRRYGATFINSLPGMPRTRDINNVLSFIRKTNI